MRIFHVSDLHIGLRLYQYDLREEQLDLLSQMVERAVEYAPDVFIIAGDVYDKTVPSAEAVRMFDQFLTKLTQSMPNMTVLIISGNHDSAERIDCFRGILCKENVYLVGVPPKSPEEYLEQVIRKDEYGEVSFYLMPFIKPGYVRNVFDYEIHSYEDAVGGILSRENIDPTRRNVLVSHQYYIHDGKQLEKEDRMSSEVSTVGNVDSVSDYVLSPFEYVALGHIHKPMPVGSDTRRYCGTPMPYSVDESGQKKGIVLVDLGAKGQEVHTQVLELTPLRQVQKLEGTLAQVLLQPSEDYVSITLTDSVDLDPFDMQNRLREAFPHMLEVRRKQTISLDYEMLEQRQLEDVSPFDMFCDFYQQITQEEKNVLQDVINAVKEAEE